MMKDYKVILANVTGVYPTVTADNASASSTADGTEWIKPVIDEWFSDQAILNHSGQTPSGATDSASGTGSTGTNAASQRLIGIQKIAGAPGEVVAWMGANADPSLAAGGDARLLPLIGQVVTIANYADLVAATYKGDGTNGTVPSFYKTSDAGGTTRDTAGAYYVLPNALGRFMRGVDTGAQVDPDGGSRLTGDKQVAAVGDHFHDIGWTGSNESGSRFQRKQTAAAFGGATTEEFLTLNGSSGTMYSGFATQRSTGSIIRTSDNRPVNMGVHWCIRY
jgi:hypothetical protein